MIIAPSRKIQPFPSATPAPSAVNITVDNSRLEATVADVQRQMLELSIRMDQTIVELATAVSKLNPGTGFSVTVTEWNQQGRIKTLKIVKE